MSDKLPTKSQFEKSIADPATVKTLVLQCFNYGTNYLGIGIGISAVGGDVTDERTKQAANILTQVWETFPQELEGVLVDIVWFVSSAIGGDETKTNALQLILKALLTVPDREAFWKELQATLDPVLLQACGLLQPDETLMKKIRKLNTELFYKQQKYNLLQEESEGYAKLLTLLFGDLTLVTPKLLREYMGTFDLDPNRVLDLLLDLLESHTQKSRILELIQDFSVTKIPNLLAFKLSCYQTSGTSIPSSLLTTIVLLAKEGLLDLAALVPTALSDLKDCYKLHETLMKMKISRLGRLSLNTDNRPDPKLQESQRLLQEGTIRLETQNALVGLLTVLLAGQNWELASTLLQTPEDWTMVCTLLPTKVGQELCNWVSARLYPSHDENVKTPKLKLFKNKNSEGAATTAKEKENGNGSSKETVEEVLASCYSALLALGQSGCLGTKPILYCKLCRLIRAILLQKSTDNLSPTVYNLLKYVLVPSLSLLPPNPAIAADLWSLLSILPYATRYQLYRDWRGGGLEKAGMGSKPLLQVQCEMEAGKAARYTLKRLSKDNVRDMGRQVSKVTHSNPLVVFSTILAQIESYDNLIQMMVETVRFVTPLSLDVLGYCVLTRLSGTVGGVNRSRLKDDGVNVSQWLQSLEGFTGAFYKKCPDVEFRGIMAYLVHRLKDGHVLELGVLKTLIKTAGGYSFADYSPAASLSAQQLEGRAGSLLLKKETFAFGIVEELDFRASARVKSVLQSNNFGVTMLILLAQTRSRLLFDAGGTKKKYVKLVANLLDTCQVVMDILLEFITDSTMSKIAKDAGETSKGPSPKAIVTYAASLPSLEKLFDSYKLDAVSAWMLCRPIYRAILNGEKGDQFKLHEGDRKQIVRRMLPEGAWKDITPDLFDTFFSFSLYDIYFPESSYKAELTRLKDTDQRLAQKKKSHKPDVHGMEFTREDELSWERVKLSAIVLAEDMEKQKKHCESIRKNMKGTVKKLFPSKDISIATIQTFITHCIYPRCKLNPDEATYCVRFVMNLHTMKTPGFSTMQFIDEFMKVLSGALYSSTEDEAASIGIILLELWKVVSRWRYDKGAFEDEVTGKPGAVFVGENGAAAVSFEDYKLLYNKWHAAIGRATIGCLDSTEYMHVRACFVILTRIVDAFPTRPKLGQQLLDSLEPLQDETYPLQDIKTAAHAYGTLLVKARGDGVWKEEDAATIKAREEKEKAEVAAKLKRREDQLAEMERDTVKLSAEIGESGRRDDRGGGRRGPPGDSRGDTKNDSRRPNFEPPKLQQQSSGANVSHRDAGNGNGDRGRRVASDSDRAGSRSDRNNNSRDQQSDRQGGQQQQQESLKGRWERGQNQSGINKRDRSPAKGDDQPSTKRPRAEGRPPSQNSSANFEPPARGGHREGGPAGQQQQQQRGERRGDSRRGAQRRV